MKIILFQPQIPQNTGNIVRTCAVTGCELILIPPLGFSVSNRHLKRAGLDYWDGVDVTITEDLEGLLKEAEGNCYFFSKKAETNYVEFNYHPDSVLIFGSEIDGLPPRLHKKFPENFGRIPMLDESRCLNLSTSVGIVVYEALRQQGFAHLQ